MAKLYINPGWQKDMIDRMNKGEDIDSTSSYNPGVQWLIVNLSSRNIPYRLINLGAGVKRVITSEIDKCPCCKRGY